ncbi:MAG: hypothetical protein MMC33_008456 [Icmadophila ericetorum]|nr:hypothetical protein [Icmadophila ericetorum]
MKRETRCWPDSNQGRGTRQLLLSSARLAATLAAAPDTPAQTNAKTLIPPLCSPRSKRKSIPSSEEHAKGSADSCACSLAQPSCTAGVQLSGCAGAPALSLTSHMRVHLLRAQEGPVGRQRPRRNHAELGGLAAERLLLRALHRAHVSARVAEHGVRLKPGLLDGPSSHSAPCTSGSESVALMTERHLRSLEGAA